MESDNKFENDTGGMSVDEIIADIDRKAANAAALEENSVGVTPEGENEMADEQAAVSADEADTAAEHIPVDDESTIDELSGADEMSDGQEALEEKSAELAEEANADAPCKRHYPVERRQCGAYNKKNHIYSGIYSFSGDSYTASCGYTFYVQG